MRSRPLITASPPRDRHQCRAAACRRLRSSVGKQCWINSAMPTYLPNANQAVIDIRKIEDYCLSPTHPRGRHKARVFREALDLQRSDAAWLRDILLEAAHSSEASPIAVDPWGTQWRLDATVRRQGKSAVVRTIWIVRTGES